MEPVVLTPGLDWAHYVTLGVMAFLLPAAVYLELDRGRIPNWLTYGAAACGLALGGIDGGLAFGASVAGFVVGFGFLFVFYLYGGMGGGDVKLMGAVGALTGFPLVVTVIFFTSFVGLALLVFMMIWSKAMYRGARRSMARRFFRKRGAAEDDGDGETVGIPYGLAIAGGSLLTLVTVGWIQ